jgi:hypothetical protein
MLSTLSYQLSVISYQLSVFKIFLYFSARFVTLYKYGFTKINQRPSPLSEHTREGL